MPRWLHGVGVLVVSALAGIYYQWPILSAPGSYHWDAAINLAWVRRYRQPGILDDPMSNALEATGFPPPVPDAYYRLASLLGDPVIAAEWLGLALLVLSAWLVFKLVERHTTRMSGAWIAVALFLATQSLHRFAGGYPHAFALPILLATAFFLIRRQNLLAALMPVLGMLAYAPSAIVALLALGISAVALRPFRLDAGRVVFAVGSGAACAIVVLLGYAGGGETISRAQAEMLPEFGPSGVLRFFDVPVLELLRSNFSGFDLRAVGSLVVLTALALVLVRPRSALAVRREIWAMVAASLILFAVAHALLFRLYLPHRYTYALLPVACIVIGVVARPALDELRARFRSPLAVTAAVVAGLAAIVALAWMGFPLGPMLDPGTTRFQLGEALPYMAVGAGAAAVAALLHGLGRREARADFAAALVSFGLLVGLVVWANGLHATAARCHTPLTSFLSTLPRESIISGDPFAMTCVPLGARRPVVISRRQYQPLLGREYFFMTRERMFDTVHALYGSNVDAILDLRRKYGADYFVVNRAEVRGRLPAWVYNRRYYSFEPFTSVVTSMREASRDPAALRLPKACRVWRERPIQVFDLECVERRAGEVST